MSGSERQLLRIAVGLLVSFCVTTIVMAFATADLTAAMLIFPSILAASVICTLGIGLIVWVPLFWLVGFVVLAIAELFGFSRSRVQATLPVQRDIRAITGYIHQSRVQGASDTQIATRLREKGWTDDEISRAFQTFNSSHSQ